MSDKPIVFSDMMMLALREGQKTQTRRTLKVQPVNPATKFLTGPPYNKSDWIWPTKSAGCTIVSNRNTAPARYLEDFPLPYAVGDHLYVRESYYQFGHWEPVQGAKTKGGKQKWGFIADRPDVLFEAPENCRLGRHHSDSATPAWHKRLGRFMPRAASRMTLIVTDVRVQRLHEISIDDAVAEGIEDVTREIACRDPSARFWKRYRDGGWNGYVDDPIGSYASLWTEINGAGSWEANPWVQAISFTVHHCNISKMERP